MFSQLSLGKKLFGLILISLFFVSSIEAGIIKYPISEIPDSLKKNAKSIIRKNQVEFNLINLNKSITHKVIAITVMDRNAISHGAHTYFYDNDREITSIKATIYNQYGVVIEQFARKDFYNFSYDAFGSLYNDARAYQLKGACNEFPYTLEFEVTIESNNSYSLTNWRALENYDQSLQYGQLKVTVPPDYEIKYLEKSFPSEAKIIKTNKKHEYLWEVENIPAVKYEPFAPPFRERAPIVFVSPTQFQYEEYKGNMTTWRNFGMFFNELNKGRDDISEELKSKIFALVDGINNPIEKAKIIYKYLQENTRYVSIQVGIGGIQPFPASTVEKYGYGDCKALTNYMKTLLHAVGIKSYYALIESGKYRYKIDTNFIHDPYNHIILNLPIGEEEIWLECTSQIIPFGFLGDFTDNRYALVITENGGVLKKTTSYAKDLSQTTRVAQVNIKENGEANAKIETAYTGLYYDDILGLLNEAYDSQKDRLYDDHISIPDFKINSFSFEDNPAIVPFATEKLDLDLINYCTVSGSRIFIPTNLMNRFEGVPRRDSERQNPFRILKYHIESDTIVYTLPDNYNIENIPKNVDVEGDFGNFSIEYEVMEKEVRFIRNLYIEQGEHPKELYNNFVDFCRAISKADKKKIVLVAKSE